MYNFFNKKDLRYLLSRILRRSGACRALTFSVHGQKLRFYPTDLSAELWYDPEVRSSDEKFLRAFLKPDECYVDVGANIGSTVIAGAAAVGPAGHVLAVEPHPRIFRYMLGNLALNGIENVRTWNLAMAGAPGSAAFSDSKSDDQNHIEQTGKGSLTVELATLDSLTVENKTVELLKIDVEGYEPHVLAGGGETLLKSEAVYIEIADPLLRKFGSSAESVLRTLREAGFHLLRWAGIDSFEEIVGIPTEFPGIENILAVRNIERARSRLAPVIRIDVSR